MWTGDLGRVDEDGFLHITGRKKEMLITAGGENVHPVPIEISIKEQLPAVSTVMLVGDGLKFLSCLITLRTEVDDEGAPTQQLQPDVIRTFAKLGSTATTVEEARQDPLVLDYLMEDVARYNETAESNAKTVKKLLVLPEDFSIQNGLLTPTQKLKRNVVLARYEDEITELYNV